jgi:hypothetical protein
MRFPAGDSFLLGAVATLAVQAGIVFVNRRLDASASLTKTVMRCSDDGFEMKPYSDPLFCCLLSFSSDDGIPG